MNKMLAANTAVVPSISMMEIHWSEGIERFEFDTDTMSESTEIRRTVQHVDEEASDYHYRVTSTVKRMDEDRFEIRISYEHARNKGIDVATSWWGTTSIVLKRGDRTGEANWHDANYPENNCIRSFEIVEGKVGDLGLAEDEVGEQQVFRRTPQKATRRIPRFVVGQQYRRAADIHDQFGGSRQSGISPSAVSDAIFIFTGDSGEQHGYKDFEEVDEDGCRVFHYCGEGQVGDMTLTRGNLAISRHSIDGKAIHLFKNLGKSKPVQYLGDYMYLDHYYASGKDRGGQNRQIIVFKLVRSDDLSVLDDSVQHDSSENETIDLATARSLALAAAAAQKEAGESARGSRNLYIRSRRVRDYVLLRASGKCELCSAPAPFLKPDGQPYLEPHHTTRVSDGGPDHPLHVGALCPSCHREIHFGQNGAKRNAELQARLRCIETM